MQYLGNRIKFLRTKYKLTQENLGEIVGLHGSNIGRIENNKVYPTADILLKISTYFKVSCDWLLTGVGSISDICENADENILINSYRELSDDDKKEILNLIEYKIYKAKEKAEKLSYSENSIGNKVI
ncbi:MAG: helix-turn-helix domain-containing protein [Lachnospiraceae bacterium]|nr:helix-turn-helix domain-containing protein [Lachnospiraceae bacterium]